MPLLRLIIAAALLGSVASQAEQARLSPMQRDAKARAFFTDTVLVTHLGRDVRFYSDALDAKVVLLNFVFTQCGDACPLITAQLVRAKQELGAAFGKDVRFVSLSLDPEFDTPEQLAKFASKLDAVHPEWWFLTGEKARVDGVVKKLGAYVEEIESHSTAIIIGNPRAGRWKKLRPDAPPRLIAEELRRLAAGQPG
jgi:protein SCO1